MHVFQGFPGTAELKPGKVGNRGAAVITVSKIFYINLLRHVYDAIFCVANGEPIDLQGNNNHMTYK